MIPLFASNEMNQQTFPTNPWESHPPPALHILVLESVLHHRRGPLPYFEGFCMHRHGQYSYSEGF